ncbi:MAG: hypothetical protein JSU04_11875 [Bdellovibrionales bacterium]|nr:hypothetical protein [Bdellovibrionales bacterium]
MNLKSMNTKSVMGILVVALVLTACGKKAGDDISSSSADESASGAAASAVGGALSGTSANGSLAIYKMREQDPVHGFWMMVAKAVEPAQAMASSLCPTFATTGTGCSASGSSMWLTYSGCTFQGYATWTGVQKITKSSGAATCGSFPTPPASGTLYRQFVSASGSNTPGSVTVIADNWSGVIDNTSSNLSNFDGQTINTIQNGGYGAAVSFNSSGARTGITLGHRTYVTGVFDHSVTGSLSVTEGNGASSRTVSGQVTVYHNRVRVVGTSTFSNVVHEDVCCLPVSGTITTSFAAGSNVSPTVLGSALVGKTETLTFTGCGTATYTSTTGAVSNVSLHRCF